MKTKICLSCCPECGSRDIDWGEIEVQSKGAYQKAVCEKCGCCFNECYEYKETEWGY